MPVETATRARISPAAGTAPGRAKSADSGAEDSAKRRQIIDGARKVFLDDGFDAASMNDIARIAGSVCLVIAPSSLIICSKMQPAGPSQICQNRSVIGG